MVTKNPRIAEVLAPLRAQLEAERDEILRASAPLHERRQALLDKIQPLEAQLKAVEDEIDRIEQPAIRNVGNELAAIERQLGAVTLVNEGPATQDEHANG